MANGKPLPKDKDKKVKVKSVTKLKKELDTLHSKYIRRVYSRDGVNVECYTCLQLKPIKSMQCGHFISRSVLYLRWDIRNTRPQCWGCNCSYMGGGQPAIFAERLSQEYGENIISQLYREARIIYKDIPYEKLIEECKEKLKLLENE